MGKVGLEKLFFGLYRRFANRNLPRNYVLIFDFLVVFFAYVLSYITYQNFVLGATSSIQLASEAVFSSVVYLIFIFLFRSYSGIIRHTGFYEVIKLFKTTAFAFVVLITLRTINRYLLADAFFHISFPVLFMQFFIAFSLMIGARVIIRNIYRDLIMGKLRTKRNVVIFGAGSSGRLTLEALKHDKQTAYQVVAFLDDNFSKAGMVLDGIPVFSTRAFFEMQNSISNKVNLFIVSVQNLGADRRREIIELALAKNYEVKVVPPVQAWLNNSLSATQLRKVSIEELMERPVIKLDGLNVAASIENRVVLITGAAGSIGSGLARQVLLYKPQKLLLLDQAESALFDLQFEFANRLNLNEGEAAIEFVVGNINDAPFMTRLFEENRPHIVYHVAAYKHVPLMEENPYMALLVNVFGTRLVADLAIRFGTTKFVMVSTDKAVNPSSVMGATKRIAEIYVQSLPKKPTQFITTRFGNVLDSNGSVVPVFKRQIEQGGPVTVTHRDITRYFMMIPEACSLVLEAGVIGCGGEIFVFDMGRPVKIWDLAKRMIQLSGFTPGKDIEIKEIGMRAGEKLFEELLFSGETHIETYHPKIMRVKACSTRYEVINKHLEELLTILQSCDFHSMVAKMKDIAPEYVPQNSIYDGPFEQVKSGS
jgi:FlaA1/EpsC-like NDP-sugar epimerase